MLCLLTCRSLWQDQGLQLNVSFLCSWPLCSQSCLTRCQDQQVGPVVRHWLFALHILFAGKSWRKSKGFNSALEPLLATALCFASTVWSGERGLFSTTGPSLQSGSRLLRTDLNPRSLFAKRAGSRITADLFLIESCRARPSSVVWGKLQVLNWEIQTFCHFSGCAVKPVCSLPLYGFLGSWRDSPGSMWGATVIQSGLLDPESAVGCWRNMCSARVKCLHEINRSFIATTWCQLELCHP